MTTPKDDEIDFELLIQELTSTFKWAAAARKSTSNSDSHRRECASVSIAAAQALVALAAEQRIRREEAPFKISKPG